MTRDAFAPRRTLPAIAAMSLAALALSGCSWMSPRQTDITYPPADGVEVDLGSVKVTNLLVVSDAKGHPGAVVGSVANSGTTDTTISVAGKEYPVPAGGVLNLQTSGVTLPSVDAAPGAMTKVSVAAAQSGTRVTDVPVLAPEGIYATATVSGAPAPSTTPATPQPAETTSPSAEPTH